MHRLEPFVNVRAECENGNPVHPGGTVIILGLVPTGSEVVERGDLIVKGRNVCYCLWQETFSLC